MEYLQELIQNKDFIHILWIVLFTFIAEKLSDIIFRVVLKSNKHLHMNFLRSIAKFVIIVYGLIAMLNVAFDLKNLSATILASGGLVIAIIGFVAQESLRNIITGMMISIFQPFQIEDRIKLVDSNITGFVEDITLRHTVIRTFNNSRLIIPNSVIDKEKLENSHFKDERAGAFVDVAVEYDTDLDRAKEIIFNIIEKHPLYIDFRTEEEIEEGEPKVTVVVRDIGVNGIWLRATMWTREVGKSFIACSEIRQEVVEAFRAEGIKIFTTKLPNNNN